MPNRVIEAKRLKMQRQGKSKRFAKAWMSSGTGPNMEVVAGYAARARINPDQEYLDKMFPGSPMANARINHIRERLLKLARESDPVRNFVLFSDSRKRVRAFFNIEHTLWYMVKEDFDQQVVFKSITYGSKARLLDAYNRQKIVYTETVSLQS